MVSEGAAERFDDLCSSLKRHASDQQKLMILVLSRHGVPPTCTYLKWTSAIRRRCGSNSRLPSAVAAKVGWDRATKKADIQDLDFGAATGEQLQNNRAALFQEEVNRGPNFYGVGETTRDVRFDAPNWIVPSKGVSTS
jgi:hypothetical protein